MFWFPLSLSQNALWRCAQQTRATMISFQTHCCRWFDEVHLQVFTLQRRFRRERNMFSEIFYFISELVFDRFMLDVLSIYYYYYSSAVESLHRIAHSAIVLDFVIHTVSFLSISWANAFFVDSFVHSETALVLSWIRCEILKWKMEEGTAKVAAAIISSTFFFTRS